MAESNTGNDSEEAIELCGEPVQLEGATEGTETINPGQRVQITVFVHGRSSDEDREAAILERASKLPRDRQPFDRKQWSERNGAVAGQLETVQKFALERGLAVVKVHPATRSVVLEGALDDFAKIFRVKSVLVNHERGRYRSYKGSIWIPKELKDVVEAVVGFDQRPLSAFRTTTSARTTIRLLEATARFYKFPRTAGRGQCIGIIAPGSGYHESDLREYCRQHDLQFRRPTEVEADGGNDPASIADIQTCWEALKEAVRTGTPPVFPPGVSFPDAHATVETTFNIEMVATLAPEAKIVVYFGSEGTGGMIAAFNRALEDEVNNPSVITCSFGLPEPQWPPLHRTQLNRLFSDRPDVTICISSGNSFDQPPSGQAPAVYFPASSPFALACGGTTLTGLGTTGGATEIAWTEMILGKTKTSVGGISARFSNTPTWQANIHPDRQRGRRVPDVASKANQGSRGDAGYHVYAGGLDLSVGGGTSAAAPLWAALIACLNEQLGVNIGYINPLLYSPPFAGAMRDITKGGNQFFRASDGWDFCTGWGSPDGVELARMLR